MPIRVTKSTEVPSDYVVWFRADVESWRYVYARDFDGDLSKARAFAREYVTNRKFWQRANSYVRRRKGRLPIQHHRPLSLSNETPHPLVARLQPAK